MRQEPVVVGRVSQYEKLFKMLMFMGVDVPCECIFLTYNKTSYENASDEVNALCWRPDIQEAKDLYETESDKILNKTYYDDILCLYDFNTINNLGIVYDESKYTHFMERVPDEFILE